MKEPDYHKGQFDDFSHHRQQSMGSKKCICFTVLNLSISAATCVLLIMVLNSKDNTCLDDDMIISEDYSQMAVKSVVHEASGDWGNVDDDELTIPFDYQPYDVTSDLKVGVEYRTIVDGTLEMRADAFRQNQWDPSSPNFARYGKRYLKKSGMYEYKQLENTPASAHYTYKVKMSSMIGPDHADQEQIHHVLVNTPHRLVIKVTAKTQNFPYSEAFNIEQIWLMENIDGKKMRLMAKTGIDWIDEPNFMIKGFIEKDIADSQVKMGKFLKSIYPLGNEL